MRAEILTIGDELCRGEIVDTNSATLAALLWDLDITPRWLTSCNDDAGDIAAAVRAAVGRADLVICSGGLGPTEDDLTVDVLAGLAGGTAVVDQPSRARLEAWFAATSRGSIHDKDATISGKGSSELAAIQLRQVRIPSGARVHPNLVGLAPGFELALSGIPVLCLPGFPREVAGILGAGMRARIAELRGAHGQVERIARRIYRVFGRGESQISRVCRGLVDDVPGATIHYQVKFPETLVKLVVRDADAAAGAARLEALDAALRERLAGPLYATGDEAMVDRVVRRLLAAGRSVATAESCTGGMIGEMLTRVPGSSRSYVGGAITYSNAEKQRQLGVSEATLATHGAVSEATVREMAEGAVARFATDYAVAVSGIAGPDGGTPDKPVGTVWLALARNARSNQVRAESEDSTMTRVRKLSFPSTRDQIRQLAAWWALAMIDAALAVDGAVAAEDFDDHAAWRLRGAGGSP